MKMTSHAQRRHVCCSQPPSLSLGDGRERTLGPLKAQSLRAAQRTGDRRLLAQLHVLNGKYLVARGRLSDAVEELSLGAEQLREDGDVFGELCALVELGHRQMGIRAALGVTTLQQAYAVLDREEAKLRELVPSAALNRLRGRIEGSIGVAELDHGHFDTAIEVLQRSVTRLQQGKMYDFSAMHSNFLGQALVATGRFEEAEQVLRDVIDLLGGEAESSSQTAYNLGLLASYIWNGEE